MVNTRAKRKPAKLVKKQPGRTVASKTKAKTTAVNIGHPGIGAFVKGLLISGKTTDEILRAVARQFPGAQTSRASVSWYRSQMNKEKA